jgi:serine/threonine protein kinase
VDSGKELVEDAGDTVIGRDHDLGALLVQRGLIAPFELWKLVQEIEARKGTPRERRLGDLLVEAGRVDAPRLEALRTETRRMGRCAGCGKHYLISYCNPNASYTCRKCGGTIGSFTGPAGAATPNGLPTPPASSPLGESTLMLLAGAEQTMLDLNAPRPRAPAPPKPAPPARPAAEPAARKAEVPPPAGPQPLDPARDKPPQPAAGEATLMLLGGAEQTMLDLNAPRPRAPAPPRAPVPARPPAGPDPTLLVPPGADPTLLDLNGPPRAAKSDPTLVVPRATAEPTMLDLGKPLPAADVPTVQLSRPPAHAAAAPPAPKGGPDPRFASRPGGQCPPEVDEARKDPKRLIGKYVIVKELGRGGTAVVYKAWDMSLAQFVALKIVRIEEGEDTQTSDTGEELRHFQREAQMAARLRHPNIVRIYELGSAEGKHYLSMELIEGPTFFELIHGGKQRNNVTIFQSDPEKFLTIMRDVARAVHYAHTQNPPVIHRDLKPQNVLVTMDGLPCVADFGLAKEVDLGRSDTVTGVVKGTPSYMAPEQAEGNNRETDQRTDVYSLGAILYEVLTGRPPFVGDSVRHVLNQIVSKLPDRPNDVIARNWEQQQAQQSQSTTVTQTQSATQGLFRTRRKKGPPIVARQLETICLKSLEKRKADRYQSAKDLASDIDRFLQHLEIEAREPGLLRKGIRKMRAHPLITGVAAALLMAAGVAATAVEVARRGQREKIGLAVRAAEEHLQSRDWTALLMDVERLRGIDKGHSSIEKFDRALKGHQEDLERRRLRWDEELKKLKAGSPAGILEALRGLYRDAGELKPELRDRLVRAHLELQSACVNKCRDLVGSGAREEWLTEKVRLEARAQKEAAAYLLALPRDPDFRFQTEPIVQTLSEGVGRILAYEGTWTFRANVIPFAEVILTRDGQEVSREFTPLALRDLEVAKGYKVELCWPSRAEAKQRSSHEITGLRHGSAIAVTGDAARAEIRVSEQKP